VVCSSTVGLGNRQNFILYQNDRNSWSYVAGPGQIGDGVALISVGGSPQNNGSPPDASERDRGFADSLVEGRVSCELVSEIEFAKPLQIKVDSTGDGERFWCAKRLFRARKPENGGFLLIGARPGFAH
jgi:hypothetical protein